MTAHIVWDRWQTVPDLWSCGGKGFVSKTAVHPFPKLLRIKTKCLSVGGMQLSDTGIGNELTFISQVTPCIAGQRPLGESRSFEHNALLHRKPVQLAEHMRDMITSPGAHQEWNCCQCWDLCLTSSISSILWWSRDLLCSPPLEVEVTHITSKWWNTKVVPYVALPWTSSREGHIWDHFCVPFDVAVTFFNR